MKLWSYFSFTSFVTGHNLARSFSKFVVVKKVSKAVLAGLTACLNVCTLALYHIMTSTATQKRIVNKIITPPSLHL